MLFSWILTKQWLRANTQLDNGNPYINLGALVQSFIGLFCTKCVQQLAQLLSVSVIICLDGATRTLTKIDVKNRMLEGLGEVPLD